MNHPHETDLRQLNQRLTSIVRNTRSPVLYAEMARRAGVGLPQHLLGVLARLRDNQPLRLTDLADMVEHDRSTVSRQIAELIAAGYVRKEPDPVDRRASLLVLTPEGHDGIDRVWAAWLELLKAVAATWPADDLKTFDRLLTRFDKDLSDAVDQACSDASP